MRSRQSGHHLICVPEQFLVARQDPGEFGEDTVVESRRSFPVGCEPLMLNDSADSVIASFCS